MFVEKSLYFAYQKLYSSFFLSLNPLMFIHSKLKHFLLMNHDRTLFDTLSEIKKPSQKKLHRTLHLSTTDGHKRVERSKLNKNKNLIGDL